MEAIYLKESKTMRKNNELGNIYRFLKECCEKFSNICNDRVHYEVKLDYLNNYVKIAVSSGDFVLSTGYTNSTCQIINWKSDVMHDILNFTNRVLAVNNYRPLIVEDFVEKSSGRYSWGKDNIYEIKEVIYNKPATIIFWKDGTKTVVKCSEDDCYDKEKGFLMAYMKKVNGNNGTFNDILNRFCPMSKEAELDAIADAITDMTINGASTEEIEKAVKKSINIISQDRYADMLEDAYNEGFAKAAEQVKELQTPVSPKYYLTTKQYASKVKMSESVIRHKCLRDPGYFRGPILRGPQGYQIPWYGED